MEETSKNSNNGNLYQYLKILDEAYKTHTLQFPNDMSYHESNRRRNQVQLELQKIDRYREKENTTENLSTRVKEALELQLRKYFSANSSFRVSDFSVKQTESDISSEVLIVIQLTERVESVFKSSFQFSDLEIKFINTGKSWG